MEQRPSVPLGVLSQLPPKNPNSVARDELPYVGMSEANARTIFVFFRCSPGYLVKLTEKGTFSFYFRSFAIIASKTPWRSQIISLNDIMCHAHFQLPSQHIDKILDVETLATSRNQLLCIVLYCTALHRIALKDSFLLCSNIQYSLEIDSFAAFSCTCSGQGFSPD